MSDYVDRMTRAYLEAALFTDSVGEDFARAWARETGEDEPASDVSFESFGFTVDSLTEAARADARSACAEFIEAAGEDLAAWDAEQAGHDLWLTRNGHGAGFWDRGFGEAGERLSELARSYGEACVQADDPHTLNIY